MTFTPLVTGPGLTGYAFVKRTQAEQIARLAASPQPAREIAGFKEKIASVQSVDDLMNDRGMLRVALGAFGLDEDIDNVAFVRQVLESDLSDNRSLANRLADKRYLALAQAFDFAGGAPRLPGLSAEDSVRADLARAGSVGAFIADPVLLSRALEAFGIEDAADRPIFLSRVLNADLDDPDSLVNRLDDPRYIGLSRALKGGGQTLPPGFAARVGETVAARLQSLGSADELVENRALLRSALSVFGLEGQAGNTYFLREVLNSNLDDPNSFANRLSDPRYAELAGTFGFARKTAAAASVYGFADAFEARLEDLETADDLIADRKLLRTALDVFGIDEVEPDFLRDVLNSDLQDETSVANTAEDPRFRALADVFGFGEMLTGTPREEAQERITDLIEATAARSSPVADVDALFEDIPLMLATMNFFGVEQGAAGVRYAKRALDSLTPGTRFSGILTPDARYVAFFGAMDFRPEPEGRVYPPGFADAVADAYLERQFELRLGEVDPDLRVAFALERELSEVADRFTTDNSRWFAVLSSPPLRLFFETSFGLPATFGTIDLDQQVEVLRSRSARAFGTSEISAMLDPETLEEMRRTFLTAAQISPRPQLNAGGAPILSLLSG